VTKTPALSDGEVSSSEEQKVSIDHDADLVKAKVPASPAKVGMSEKADSDVDEAQEALEGGSSDEEWEKQEDSDEAEAESILTDTGNGGTIEPLTPVKVEPEVKAQI